MEAKKDTNCDKEGEKQHEYKKHNIRNRGATNVNSKARAITRKE